MMSPTLLMLLAMEFYNPLALHKTLEFTKGPYTDGSFNQFAVCESPKFFYNATNPQIETSVDSIVFPPSTVMWLNNDINGKNCLLWTCNRDDSACMGLTWDQGATQDDAFIEARQCYEHNFVGCAEVKFSFKRKY